MGRWRMKVVILVVKLWNRKDVGKLKTSFCEIFSCILFRNSYFKAEM